MEIPTRDEYERSVIATATAWRVVAFRGRERGYVKRLVRTLTHARNIARAIYENRPVGIYAIAGTRFVLAELYDPLSPESRRLKMFVIHYTDIKEPHVVGFSDRPNAGKLEQQDANVVHLFITDHLKPVRENGL